MSPIILDVGGSGGVAGNVTVGDILDEIQAFGFGNDAEAEIVQRSLVNLGHREICAKRRWSWLEFNDPLTTVANVPTVDLAPVTDLRAATEIDAVSVEEIAGQYEVPLEYLSPTELRYRQQHYGSNLAAASQNVGIPQQWSVSAGELQLWPIPDAVYTLNVSGLRGASTLDSDDDVPLIPSDHCPVLVHYAVRTLASRTREWDLRNDAIESYREALRELENAEGLRQRSNPSHVRESGFHQAAERGDDWEY